MATVFVLTNSETMSLRLRLLAEGEGATARAMPDAAQALAQAADARLLVVDGSPPGMALADLADAWKAGNPAAALLVIGEAPAGLDGVLSAPPSRWEYIRQQMARGLSEANAAARPDFGGERAAFDAALGQARILVVDDSVTFREYLRGELAREGATVRCTGNARDVLPLVEADEFDCVLLDLVMPGEDGAVLCEQFARLRRERGLYLYIAVMSSRESEADLVRSLVAGADDFFGKSQNLSVMKAKLRAILRRKFLMETLFAKNPGAV